MRFLLRWLWPPIENLNEARVACRHGSYACIFLMLGTLLMVAEHASSPSLYPSALAYAFLAIGIFRVSRVSAIAALLLFLSVTTPVLIADRAHALTGEALSLLLMLILLTSIRGTFHIHRLNRQHAPTKSSARKDDAA